MNALRTTAAAAWTVALIALVCASGASAAAKPKTCKPPKYPGVGYFTAEKVTGVTCATGNKVMVAQYKCRLKKGTSGVCSAKVMGFTCKEKRNSIPTEIDARVTCTKSKEKVEFDYQQDT
jgi:hypothetical protein